MSAESVYDYTGPSAPAVLYAGPGRGMLHCLAAGKLIITGASYCASYLGAQSSGEPAGPRNMRED